MIDDCQLKNHCAIIVGDQLKYAYQIVFLFILCIDIVVCVYKDLILHMKKKNYKSLNIANELVADACIEYIYDDCMYI